MAENLTVNLFGDLVAERREGRGRPEHLWSLENSNKVLLAFARGLSVKQAAMVIGISGPTLRKVYFDEVAIRQQAQIRLEMTQLERLNAAAKAGNITAEKELFKQMERLRSKDQAAALASQAPAKAPPKQGKKEAAAQAAGEVRGLYEPPSPPRNVIN